jgi:hypothetical protein
MRDDDQYSSELERDLAKKVDDQVTKLVANSLNEFLAAEFDAGKSAIHICEALMSSAAKLMAGFTTASPKKAGNLFEKLVEFFRKDAERYLAERKAEMARKH